MLSPPVIFLFCVYAKGWITDSSEEYYKTCPEGYHITLPHTLLLLVTKATVMLEDIKISSYFKCLKTTGFKFKRKKKKKLNW